MVGGRVRKWVIYASEFASFVGQHKYQNQHETILEVLIRAGYVKHVTKRWKVGWAIDQIFDGPITEILTTEQVVDEIKHAEKKQKVSAEEVKLVLEQVDAVTNQLAGRASEHQIVAKEQITNNNSQLHTLWLDDDKLEKKRVKVVGKIDGFKDNVLVELKRRKWPIRDGQSIPVYDVIQCTVYMAMLKLKETMLKESSPENERTTSVPFDDAKWQEWKRAAIDVCTSLDQLVQNPTNLANYKKLVQLQNWPQCAKLFTKLPTQPNKDRQCITPKVVAI
jgi:hypothetical protein